jgi:flagellar biosynthesis component FlhA
LVFWQVLLELAREQVPVNRPGEVLTAFLEIPLSSTSLPEIVTRLRMVLRPHLPGNTPSAHRIPLPADLEAELSGYVQTHDGLAYLVLTRADQDRLLARIKDLLVHPTQAVEQADETNTRFGKPVLVCQAASLRPLLRRLIATILPQVAVLSAQEVLTEFPTEPGSSLDDQASQAAISSEPAGDSALE